MNFGNCMFISFVTILHITYAKLTIVDMHVHRVVLVRIVHILYCKSSVSRTIHFQIIGPVEIK